MAILCLFYACAILSSEEIGGGGFMSTTMVRVRMDTGLKEQVDAALASMGLNMSTAANAMAADHSSREAAV